MDSIDTEIPDVDLSQKEKTLERSDKGKSIVVQYPSSSKDKYSMEDSPRWLIKEVMVRHKKKLYSTEEEGMRELIEALEKPEPPIGNA